MNFIHSIQDFFHPSGAAARAQVRQGEAFLLSSGYTWMYVHSYPRCEFCDRELATVRVCRLKANPLGQKFKVHDKFLQACVYCQYAELKNSSTPNRTTFDKMLEVYPPCAE